MCRTAVAWFDSLGDAPSPRRSPSRAAGVPAAEEATISDRGSPPSPLPPRLVAWAEETADALRFEDRFQSASVLVHDPVAAGLRLAAQRSGPGDAGAIPPSGLVPLTGSLSGWVFRTGRPAVVGDAANGGERLADPDSVTRSELAAPILVGGRPVGVLNVESPRPGEFGIDDLARLERRAAAAAASLPHDELPAA